MTFWYFLNYSNIHTFPCTTTHISFIFSIKKWPFQNSKVPGSVPSYYIFSSCTSGVSSEFLRPPKYMPVSGLVSPSYAKLSPQHNLNTYTKRFSVLTSKKQKAQTHTARFPGHRLPTLLYGPINYRPESHGGQRNMWPC